MNEANISKLAGGQAWINWILGVLFVVFVFTLQTGYAITNVAMGKDLEISLAQIGFIGTIYTWAFAIAQFGSGSILDKLGTRWVLPIACAIVTLGAFLFAYAPGAKVLVVSQVLMAVGGSFGFVGAGFVGGQWFAPLKYGFMFCLVQFVASLSAIAGQATIGTLIQNNSWDTIITGMAITGLILTVVMFVVMRDPVKEGQTALKWVGLKSFMDELLESLREVMAIRETWINALIGGATFGSMLSLGVVWGPRYLISGGMEEAAAFNVSSVMWLGLAFGAPVFGWLSDLMKKRKTPMFFGCVVQTVAIVVILMQPTMSSTEASVWFFIWGFMSGGSMLNFPIGADLVKPALIGTSAAVVNAIQFIIGGILMAVPGRVLSGVGLIAHFRNTTAHKEVALSGSIVDYQWALSILPVTLGIALVLFYFLKETYPDQS